MYIRSLVYTLFAACTKVLYYYIAVLYTRIVYANTITSLKNARAVSRPDGTSQFIVAVRTRNDFKHPNISANRLEDRQPE